MPDPLPTPSSTDSATAATRPRRWRRRLLGIAIGLTLGGATLELVLRATTALAWPAIYELDDRLGWKHAGGVVRTMTDETGREVLFATDERGLRGTPHPNERLAGRQRVLFVGDSFTAGSAVASEELFTSRLAPLLGGAEVWNAGVGGYSTLQELRLLESVLPRWSPDLVVVVLYENDFVDNLMPYFGGLGPRPHLVVRGSVVEVKDAPDIASFERFLMPAPAAFWCYEHCAIYRTLHKNLFLPRAGDRLVALEQTERRAVAIADQQVAMQWALLQVATVVRGAGRRFVVAAIPSREAARAGAVPHPWLADWCASQQMPFHSVLAALRAAGDGAYFQGDIHLTATGHECVSRDLAPRLADLLRRRD